MTDTNSSSVCLFYNITFQRFHVFFKRIHSLWGNLTDRTRHFSFKCFRYLHITGFVQFIDLYTQVSGCSPRLLTNIDKVRFLNRNKQRHHRQAKFGME